MQDTIKTGARRAGNAILSWLRKPHVPSAERIPELNGLRVLLVFIVSWYHFWQQSWLTPHIGSYSLDFLVRAGYVPVDGTILLSGFLLFLPHARAMLLGGKTPGVRSFYERRVMRIVPSYYFITLLLLFALALPGFWSNENTGYADQLNWLPDEAVSEAIGDSLTWSSPDYPGDPMRAKQAWQWWMGTSRNELERIFGQDVERLTQISREYSADLLGQVYLKAWPAWAGTTKNGPVMALGDRLQWIADHYQGDAGRYVKDWMDNLPAVFYGSRERMWEDIVRHLTFTQTFEYSTYVGTPIGVASWTIAIEMQAYLIFPLLAWCARKKPLATFASMIAATLAFRCWCLWSITDNNYNMVVNQLANFLDVYAIGMAASLLYVKLTTLWPRQKGMQLLLSTGATVAIALLLWGLMNALRAQAGTPSSALQAGQMVRRPLFALLLGGLTLALPFALRPVRFLFGNRVMGFLAMVSMNYYLIHQNLAVFLKTRLQLPAALNYPYPNMTSGGPEMPWAQEYMLLCFVGSLLAAVLVTFLVEKPCAWLLGKGFGKVNAWIDALKSKSADKPKFESN